MYKLNITSAQLQEFLNKEASDRYPFMSKLNLGSIGTEIYGFRIRESSEYPFSRVEYLADNAYYKAAYMDYSTGRFNYGSWENAFFIRLLRPCMLGFDGVEKYLLNKNDYTKKLDGSSSDVSNTSFDGDAMVGFPTIYWYAYDEGDYHYVFISNKKVTSNFECWAHYDDLGNEIPFLYLPIFNGSVINSKMRSISGQRPNNTTADTTQISYCDAKNTDGRHIWSCYTISSWMMIYFLLVLISKGTNTQQSFGNGHYTGGSSASSLLVTGTLNDKGLFYGTNGTGVGVKVFGLENWYANIWKRVVGIGLLNYKIMIKLTYSKKDGSTVEGYNNALTGYLDSGVTVATSPASGGYQKASKVGANLLLPYQNGASDSTFLCDGLWFSSGTRIAYLGGSCYYGFLCGAGTLRLSNASGNSNWDCGAGVECRPRKS